VFLKDYEQTKNHQFDLSKFDEPLAGSFSKEGGLNYMKMNKEIVDKDNFSCLFDGRMISKMGLGTDCSMDNDIKSDFVQYVSLKHALMSGGVNHIDTAVHFRKQLSERVTGAVLKTLVHKYHFTRDQFFVTSKQGCTSIDLAEDCPRQVEVMEVIASSSGKL
jgi:predicted aldo/keto reductase-like oxidoreductase